MLIFKKRKEPQKDFKKEELWTNFSTAKLNLQNHIKHIMTLNELCKIFPYNTPEKENIKNILEKTKQDLINNAIPSYNRCREEWHKYTGKQDFTSDQVMYIACQEFYTR